MQTQPTYSYLEFLHHIIICDEDTWKTLLELLCEEAFLYNRQERLNLYGNLHHNFSKFDKQVKK